MNSFLLLWPSLNHNNQFFFHVLTAEFGDWNETATDYSGQIEQNEMKFFPQQVSELHTVIASNHVKKIWGL